MGPYIHQKNTPIGILWEKENEGIDIKVYNKKVFNLSLKMIALCRIVLRDVNICGN
jgi:hypothetical protein